MNTTRFFLIGAAGLALAGAVLPAGFARQAAKAPPLKVVIAAGEGKAHLVKYQKYLEDHYHVRCTLLEAPSSKQDKDTKKHEETPFKGVEALADCDVILSNLYRTWAPPEQLALLKKAREAAGLTQVQLAEKLGQSQSFVSKVEVGERRLDVIQLRTICVALGTTLSEFVTKLEERLSEGEAKG